LKLKWYLILDFETIVFAIISIGIASGVFLAIRIIQTKFKKLKGSQKILSRLMEQEEPL